MTRKTPEKAKKQDVFEASVRILGKLYTAQGATVRESMANLKTGTARGVSVVTLKHGNMRKERIFNAIQTSRLFNSAGMTRDIQLDLAANLFAGL